MSSLLPFLLRSRSLVLSLTLFALAQKPSPALGVALPNILWVTCEDTGQELGCYGDRYADTPSLDRLASQGMRSRYVWSCARMEV
jgi:uncharacterized sulfatase